MLLLVKCKVGGQQITLCLHVTLLCLQNWRVGSHHYGTHAWSLTCRGSGEMLGWPNISVSVSCWDVIFTHIIVLLRYSHCEMEQDVLCLICWSVTPPSACQSICPSLRFPVFSVCAWMLRLQSYNSAVLLQIPPPHCSVWRWRGRSGDDVVQRSAAAAGWQGTIGIDRDGGGGAEIEVRLVARQRGHAIVGGGPPDGLSLASCFDHQVLVVLVALQLPCCEVLDDVRRHGGRGANTTVRRVATVAGPTVRRASWAARRRASSAANNIVPLVGRFDGDDEVVAVGDHHVRHLVQRLSSHLNTVYLQDLVVHCQQAGALCQPTRHHARDEYPRDLLQALWGDPYAGAITDIEAQRFFLTVLVQANTSVRLREDVHIDDGGDRSEVLWEADDHRRFFPVGVRPQKYSRKHRVFLPGQGVRTKRCVISFLCKIKERGSREREEEDKNGKRLTERRGRKKQRGC